MKLRDNVKSSILGLFKNNITFHIYKFENVSQNADVDYLSQAIPEVIMSYLKPLENESISASLEAFDIVIPESLSNLITASNSIFSNYTTNMATTITQYTKLIATNYLETQTTNSNLIEASDPKSGKKKNVWNLTFVPNTIVQIQTNDVFSNTYITNEKKLTKELLLNLITQEFPELTNSIAFMPFIVTNEKTNISTLTNTERFSIYLSGEYKISQKNKGPNDLEIKIHLKRFVTNEVETNLTIIAREDKTPDGLFRTLKTIRIFSLEKPNGDIIIATEPAEANIYLDGMFIGKSPLYYPAVTAGKHQVSFYKQGYHQLAAEGIILENKTNFIRKKISKLLDGGTIEVNSTPTNANVFIDSIFLGATPLTVTNLTLEIEHRLKIQDSSTNYFPYYHTFTLQDTNQVYRLDTSLLEYEGTPQWNKKIYWWAAYAGWGLTVFWIGVNIYSHYQASHYMDWYIATGNTNTEYLTQYQYYNQMFSVSRSWGQISAFLIAFPLTAWALYNEEIYLGFKIDPFQGYSGIAMSFSF
jgi:hypothetical protein